MQYKKDFIKSDGRRLLKGGPRDQQLRAKAAADSNVVDALIGQIAELKVQLKNLEGGSTKPTSGSTKLFTAEQVDEEINRAVSQAMAEATISLKKGGPDPNVEKLITRYKEQIVDLQKSNDDFARMHAVIVKENKELKEKMNILQNELKEVTAMKQQIAVLEQNIANKDEMIGMLKSRPAIINGEIVNETDPNRPQMEQVFVDPLEKDAGDDLKSSVSSKEITRNVDDGNVGDKVNKLKDLLGSLPKRNI